MQTMMVKTANRYRKATVAEVCEVAGHYALQSFNKVRPSLSSPLVAVSYLSKVYAGRDYETFTVLFLDKRYQLIEASELFRGTIDGSSVHPREVAKECLWKGAASVMLAHNHPSGIAEPSEADIMITGRLMETLALIDVSVIDHLIIGNGCHCSMKERGLI